MDETGRDTKGEMPVGEWALRWSCKLLALGGGILGIGGCGHIFLTLVLQLFDEGKYVGAACTAIALVAAFQFGLMPMVTAIETVLLRLCGGMHPSPVGR